MSVPERHDAAWTARRREKAAPETPVEVERSPGTSGRRAVHPIEARSYAILRSRVDLSGLPPLRRAVTERVIHASADLEYATDLVAEEADLERGLRALRAGAPVVTDVAMVAAGITGRETVCSIADPAAARTAAATGLTRSAAAVRVSYARIGPGAIWVVGCAPTALEEIVAFGVEPALVIGLPVGFVGAAESKAALRASGLPAVSNVSEKGGSAVAAAALNALLYHADAAASGHGMSGAAMSACGVSGETACGVSGETGEAVSGAVVPAHGASGKAVYGETLSGHRPSGGIASGVAAPGEAAGPARDPGAGPGRARPRTRGTSRGATGGAAAERTGRRTGRPAGARGEGPRDGDTAAPGDEEDGA